MPIGQNKVVTMNFILKDEKGAIIETTGNRVGIIIKDLITTTLRFCCINSSDIYVGDLNN